MKAVERRYVELRAAPEGRRLEGVAVRYGDVAALPWGKERFEAGAFADRMSDVRLTVQHDRGRPLVRTGAGLTLDDNAERLALAAELPVTREADDTLTLVRAGVLRGLSIEFRAVVERMEGETRVISRATLGAVSVVDSPAYPQSEVEARRAAMPGPGRRRRVWL